MNTEILIIAEHDGMAPDPVTFEVIGWGACIAAEKRSTLGVLALGSGLDGVIGALRSSGADHVYALDDVSLATYNSQAYLEAITASLPATPPRVILLGHSYVGIELASSIAVKTGATLWSNCHSVKAVRDGYIALRPTYGGTYVTTLEIESASCNMFTMQRGGQSAAAISGTTAEVHYLPIAVQPDAPRITITSETSATFAEDITKSDLLVAVGRGIGQPSHLHSFRELAIALGGSLAGSRPIVDNGWLPVDNQVGLSGRTVRPKIYLAFGISGAAQHLAGMRDSQVIIAVNQDPNAPIFQIAHYGIVADLFQVLPALMDAAKRDSVS